MLRDITPRTAIEFAVQTEELGQKFYKKLAGRFDKNTKLKNLFEQLAQDEAAHEQQYRALMEQTPKDEFTASQYERLEYLRVMALSEFFMGEDGLYRKLKEINREQDALMRAVELEKATLQYYEAMRDVLGKNDTVDAVIEAEKDHLKKLMQYMLADAQFKGILDIL